MSAQTARASLHPILLAIEEGDTDTALTLLRAAEWEAFQRGDRAAGELAYVRWRLEGDDRHGAETALQRLLGGRR